mmetsp:Transcript_27779/g.70816  ORF Transcript_27779/g.70816 Transcript_27779/m.70816 type:complete len:418 (-) Transcript_27779:191-1444(-)|eukprot:CAMPEP_0202858536 /NCGR_PEP_ID=MMETSP1391-20130828/1025_1 /ASSEMBLY_ACC=CAM_ASM_000867 /TAXON_ID=1034604 /ORGANISM="Chlamydomonas leiostraca, Strain SAG 11-49" /LENGTH=417 /DNA_ID=CAMNT_0049537461 /DNA_START=24 /DNA_END=1277 /DNA_ORIENTATION=+
MAGSGRRSGDGAEDAGLFDTPQDLQCPITLQLFIDPVINSAGHTYERSAIEGHLAQGRVNDPLTGQILANPYQLIPVYNIKSRAAEYREKTAKACVEKASLLRSREGAVRLLRRAAELYGCGTAPLVRVPGLSSELVQYLATHTSNMYEWDALRMFADGLKSSGYADQATSVYLRLVELGEDRAQRAAALAQCLGCFTRAGGDADGLCAGEGAKAVDRAALPRLAHFIETQQALTAGQFVELMSEVTEDAQLVVQLCEYLLSRHASAIAGAPAGDTTTSSGSSSVAAGSKFQDLLLAYSRLRFNLVQAKLDTLEQAQLAPKGSTKHKQPQQPAHAQPAPPATPKGQQQPAPHTLPGSGPGRPGLVHRLGQVVGRHRRLLASGVFAGLSLFNPKHVAVRAVQAGGVLLLVHGGKKGGQ